MMLTTKTTYSVVALLDIAKYSGSVKAVRLQDISSRSNIDAAYLEQLFRKLRMSGLVKSFRGPNGGYRLTRKLDSITLFDVATAVGEKLENTTFDQCDINGILVQNLKQTKLDSLSVKGE